MTMKKDLADFDALPNAAKADYYRAKAKREADTSPEAVERLDPYVARQGIAHMCVVEVGDFVRYSDFVALAAKLAEVEAERDNAENHLQEALQWVTRAREQFDRADAAEAALATAREGLLIQAGLLTAGTCGERGKVVGERILALIERKP